jgi:hypothetical protein
MAEHPVPKRRWVRKPKAGIARATVSPTVRDLEWAAGFLDGEGCFIRAKSSKRGCEMVAAPQKDPELLVRLQSLFGGNLTKRLTKWGYHINVWQVYGSRARGVMMTLFSLLSTKRQTAIRLALTGA